MRFDPNRIAVEYYFGDFQYWKLPQMATDALAHGHDGPALTRLAGLADRSGKGIREDDIRAEWIDSAFREMGVDAPITEDKARLALAVESAQRALNGRSNVFDEATHIRIHVCHLSDPPDALEQIVTLSKEAQNAPRSQWNRIEADLERAFTVFLSHQTTQVPD
jgi:hypothetical protein